MQREKQYDKVSIRLERHGQKGWEFLVTRRDVLTGETEKGQFRTDGEGHGLWAWRKSSHQWYPDGRPFYEWRQIRGTCQFSLDSDRKRARRAIRYRWAS